MAQVLLTADPEQFLVNRVLLRALSREEAVWWRVERIFGSLRPADLAYLLRHEVDSPEPMEGGVIAVARVAAEPELRACPEPVMWRTPPKGSVWFVPLELQEVRLTAEAGMVGREAMRKSVPLAKMGLGRERGGIEARLTTDQAEALRLLWRRASALRTPQP